MSNFAPKLQDATEDQLMYMVNELDFRVVPLASDELTRRSIKKLDQTIKNMDKSSAKYSQAMMDLSLVMLFVALVQILIALVIPSDAKLYVKFIIFIFIVIALMLFVGKMLRKG
ncbi:MAG: hypothetical protein KBD52_03415 [Candidatus Pacebacteria bacterium]|nr:hypothetical protein [Candidatus Paceibacterota bacterium]